MTAISSSFTVLPSVLHVLDSAGSLFLPPSILFGTTALLFVISRCPEHADIVLGRLSFSGYTGL